MQTAANTTTPIKVFITGATGYIGGTVLNKLLESSQPGKWQVTALARSESAVPKLKELGVIPLIGSLDDSDILTKAANEADIILNLADADHMGAAKALVKGCSSEGNRKILIHCSGTGELLDDARGEYASGKIYSDLDMESINALPLTNLHRDVDTYLFDHSEGFDLVIVAPPTIYGIGTGLFNRLSILVPMLVKAYLKDGYIFTAGKGLNIWNNVHIEDLGDFFVLLIQKALEGKASVGRDGWYFCESGEHVLKDITIKIGEELKNRNLIRQAEPVIKQIDKANPEDFIWIILGGNSRCTSDRARALGWRPRGTRSNIFDSIGTEIDLILSQQKS